MNASEIDENAYRDWIPRILSSVTLATLVVLGVLDRIFEAINRLGMLLVVLVVVGVSVVGCIYIHKATEPSPILPDKTMPKYTQQTRKNTRILLGCVLVTAAVILCIKYAGPSDAENHAATDHTQHTPTTPGRYPSVDEIQYLPSLQEVEQLPPVQAENVNFRYKNASGVDLKLILYDCYYHYFPIDDALAPTNAWRIWDFPATNRFFTVSDFQRGTGWYVFFVETHDTGKRYQLGTTNIFYSEWPTLTVTSRTDKDEPFVPTFKTEE